MNDNRDPFDGPAAVGPLGQAMAGLTDEPPPAGFSEWTIRGRYESRRAVRRQALGGVAAGAAAIAVLAVLITTVAKSGSDAASTAAGTSSAAAPSTAAASSAASPAAGAAAGGTRGGTAESPDAAAGADGDAGGGPASESCRAVPDTDPRWRALEDAIPGLTPLDSCVDAGVLAAQRYAVAGGELRVEVRAGTYDPCTSTTCTDVPGQPGVRSAAAVTGGTQVWTDRNGVSYVVTAVPEDLLGIDVLAGAALALAAAGS